MKGLRVELSQVAVPLKLWWVVEVMDPECGVHYRATLEFKAFRDPDDEPSLRFHVRRTWWKRKPYGVVIKVLNEDTGELIREARLTHAATTI